MENTTKPLLADGNFSDLVVSGYLKLIWTGLAPYKIEIFCWQLLQGRLAVEDVLVKKGILSVHAWGALWNVQWVIHHEPIVCFLAWFGFAAFTYNNLIWKTAWYVIICAIWIARNEVVFKGKEWDEEHFELTKFQVAWGVEVWFRPQNGSLKFNTDGASRDCPDELGIGGNLRNDLGDTFAYFSKPIGICDSNKAELMAIREATLIYATSRWNEAFRHILECDNSNIVKWISIPRHLVIQTSKLLGKIKEW
ncbi:Uncharacterized protein TCM_038911 [Theobroma cacao]|uniref:RNase H type-1 domain-containing protein n=1 Tax=Theobroma cacao TaxID=3641 RepID=A0A061GQW1_THECC|nr:Uncharacterized protein TCM_038911 [Theobroma cacao]